MTSGNGASYTASLSADESALLDTRATTGSVVATFDVATGQQTQIVSTSRG